MVTTEPFEEHTERYEEWFETHDAAYRSEVEAVDELLPDTNRALEIGVGSGRFADPLEIPVGIDPSRNMLARARNRDIEVGVGVAEHLPFQRESFDAVLLVTTICFVDDVTATLKETRRVLDTQGRLVVGFVDKQSSLGQRYQEIRDDSHFYRNATFFSTEELRSALKNHGFTNITVRQTLFSGLDGIDTPEESYEGFGEGSFIVITGQLP